MWEAIRGNQRRSWVLIGLMGVILVTLGFLAGMTIDPQMGGALGALFALAVWLVLYLTALAGGNSILLASSNAHEIQKEDAPRLWNIVEE
ncbi:peptidase M28, partial [bacterium]|nr:peptidase M28 [bacterium]